MAELGSRTEAALHAAETTRRGRWPPAVTYAHLARWDEVTTRRIQALADGRRDVDADRAFADYRQANRLWADADEAVDVATAREWWRSARNRLILALRSLNNEDWIGLVLEIVDDVLAHYEAHVARPWEFETDQRSKFSK